jgi:hypothetical protein
MLSTVIVNDFTGGLNYRADAFQLADNESPDLLNVDIDPRGGFSSRPGMSTYGVVPSLTAGNFTPHRLFSWNGSSKQLFLAAENKIYYTSNGSISASIGSSDNPFGAFFTSWSVGVNSTLYIARGHNYQGSKWNGSTLTNLTSSGSGQWQNSYASPTGTHVPRANICATHIDRLWVADTYEGSSTYPNRIRWSHPSVAESWREQDYIDVVGGGNGITALVPLGDQLVIFKKKSVFVLLGYDEETFQLVPLTTEIGAENPKCVAMSERGIYFFSWPDGLFFYDGQTFTDLFEFLRPLIQADEISYGNLNAISVSFLERKLMISFPIGVNVTATKTYEDSTLDYDDQDLAYTGEPRVNAVNATFVLDLTIGSRGAWTKYVCGDGYGLSCATNFIEADGQRVAVAAHPYQPCLLKINQELLYRDTINGVTYDYISYYVTKWQHGDAPNSKKFWRRPEMVVRQLGQNTTLNVDVYHNWDRGAPERTFQVYMDGDEIGGGFESWGRPDLGADLVRGYNLGLCNSVQLKISASGQPWGVNAMIYKYNPRRVRL